MSDFTIVGFLDYRGATTGVRFLALECQKPYRHEVEFTLLALPEQSEDEFTAKVQEFFDFDNVRVRIHVCEDAYFATTNDMSNGDLDPAPATDAAPNA